MGDWDVDTLWKEITDITTFTAMIDSLGPDYFKRFEATEDDDHTSDQNLRDKGPPQQPSGQSSQSVMPEPENDAAVRRLSTKPFFCVVLEGQHLAQDSPGLAIPRKLHQNLPIDTVPAKIVYGRKAWHLDYVGKAGVKRFESEGWGKFVKDNDLKCGDACMFELTDGSSESSIIEFRFQFVFSN